MEEQLLPIGIDSEIAHVKSEIDRVDGIFTVATGPMGHQEVNYHIINEERDRRTIPHTPSITEIPKEKLSLKSQSPPRSIGLSSSEISNEMKDKEDHGNRLSDIPDDNDRKARFSLPEIDSTNQQETNYKTKQNSIKNLLISNIPVHSPLKYTRKEQSTVSSKASLISNFSRLDQSILEIPERCRPTVNNTLPQQSEILLPFYTLNELAAHNDSTDAWICIFGYIYDITSLIKKTQDTTTFQQFIDHTGHDISSLFDEQTNQPRMRIDPQTHKPVSLIKNLSVIERFWQTQDYLIGRLTERPRYIRLIHNFSPKYPYLLEVAEEETLGQIARKFLKYNSHIFSYIWRYNGHTLDLNKTLTDNGIPNEELLHDKYGWKSDNENCPTILLYFSDDLTIA